ncbi:MAG: hypothetical protein LBC41_15835 [Clostridiales bacterium]|jgi:hypothetical protein|nr:hypothetical protein [Clostridiales bacterium]MDR2752126.1 hypothetical protein [Clostridiales bacterium]
MKKLVSILLIALLALSLAACGNSNGANSAEPPVQGAVGNSDASADEVKTEKYTYWLYNGEDASYYANYNENPVIKYQLDQVWDTSSGKTKLDIDFWQPVTGSERDNFNTLLGTGEYADIMTMTAYDGSIVDLYKDGVILDLTEYVEKYMPHYIEFLDAHPDYAITATNVVDGEKKYLQIYAYASRGDVFWGYQYRRDWLIKYGKNPKDGSSFSGGCTKKTADGKDDPESWEDNVIFPSGGKDPIYLSDWEWMFEIFQTAIDDIGIKDGYVLSMYYPGYNENGELVSAFGGGGGHWYKTPENQVKFNASTENFRAYLQCMSTWNEKGWLDKAFPEHASDMFFRVDDVKVRQGKVGFWYGTLGELKNGIDLGDELTAGSWVAPARHPINDIYGTDESKNIAPYTFYEKGLEALPISVSDKAKDKNLEAFFKWMDYRYAPETALSSSLGFSKEEYEMLKPELYTREGLTEGAYYAVETESGTKYHLVDKLYYDGGTLVNAVRGIRIPGLDDAARVLAAMPDEWGVYSSTGSFRGSFTSQLSPEDSETYNKINTRVREFMSKNVPGFILGEKDPFSDDDWNAFANALGKYGVQEATEILQNLLDSLG